MLLLPQTFYYQNRYDDVFPVGYCEQKDSLAQCVITWNRERIKDKSIIIYNSLWWMKGNDFCKK